MPLPLIVGGALVVGSAAAGTYKIWSARKRYTSAHGAYEEAFNHYRSVVVEVEALRTATDARLQELGKVRLESMKVLGEAARFLERARVKDRKLFEKLSISTLKLLEWEKASITASDFSAGLVSSAISGAATALGAYGLVGLLASAGTGTAIATLTGAAASNATLAWLGGGALALGGGGVAAGTLVLGGLVAGPAIMAAGFVAATKVGKVEIQIEKKITELAEDEAKRLLIRDRLTAVDHRIVEVEQSTTKAAAELRRVLASADTGSEDDAYRVWRLASSLGELLEAPILHADGSIV